LTIWNRSLRVLPGPPGRRSYTTIQPGTRYSGRSSYGPARAPGNTGNTQRAIPFMAYSIRLRWPPWPSCAAATLRQPALLLDRAGDLPKAVPGGGPLAGLPGRAGRLPVVPRRSARRPRRAGWRPVIAPEFFFARAGRQLASSTSLSYRKASGIPLAPVIPAAAPVTQVTENNDSHSGARPPGHYALICRLTGGSTEKFKSFAEIVAATCSNTSREIRYSNSNFAFFTKIG
jgi:hypothetical protein